MSKKIVTYFSASGVTKEVAEKIAEAAKADIFEIIPKKPYTKADLNWTDKQSRSTLEMNDETSRPEIAEKLTNMDEYDVVFLGFPIWWYKAPTIINTFLESYDFSDKKIVLFATSGSSGLGDTASLLKSSVSNSTKIISGKLMNGRPSKEEIEKWIASLNL